MQHFLILQRSLLISAADPPNISRRRSFAYANGQLKNKIIFGSDFPLIRPQKWIEAAKGIGFKDEVMPRILRVNAARILELA